jgi:hypothetical protein
MNKTVLRAWYRRQRWLKGIIEATGALVTYAILVIAVASFVIFVFPKATTFGTSDKHWNAECTLGNDTEIYADLTYEGCLINGSRREYTDPDGRTLFLPTASCVVVEADTS